MILLAHQTAADALLQETGLRCKQRALPLQGRRIDGAGFTEGDERHEGQQQAGRINIVRDAVISPFHLRSRALLLRASPQPCS